MRGTSPHVLILLFALSSCLPAVADEPVGPGGGEWILPTHAPHLSAAERLAIHARLEASEARLREQGLLHSPVKSVPLLSWPLQAAAGFDDYGFHGISNFVDLDPDAPDALLDYNCGQRTYDLDSGYNHGGVDIYLWPFSWNKVDDDQVEIVAAAAGTILDKRDGNFDRSCDFGGSWNAVYIMHADASVAWYGHMKNGSVTTKAIGATVDVGEVLGVVASSGSSTGPHLHFELYDSDGSLTDPWFGDCNPRDGSSAWVDQRPYHDSAVNHLGTGFAPPDWGACPTPTVKNERSAFDPGERIYFLTYYRDQLFDQLSTYTIYRPDGSTYAQWDHASPAVHYSSSWWYWSYGDLSTEGPPGLWRFEVEFEGELYEHFFSINGWPAGDFGESLRLAKFAEPALLLTWGASCRGEDSGFGIHEGALGDFESHGAVECLVGSPGSLIVGPAGGARYYLVVPTSASAEGSYGRDSEGVERKTGSPSCFLQDVDCP